MLRAKCRTMLDLRVAGRAGKHGVEDGPVRHMPHLDIVGDNDCSASAPATTPRTATVRRTSLRTWWNCAAMSAPPRTLLAVLTEGVGSTSAKAQICQLYSNVGSSDARRRSAVG